MVDMDTLSDIVVIIAFIEYTIRAAKWVWKATNKKAPKKRKQSKGKSKRKR